jgi:hypothetical protein
MLQLRVYGDRAAMAAAAEDLGRLPGTRHVGLSDAPLGRRALVTADLRPEAADDALARLAALGIPSEDIALVRLETIGPVADESLAVVWADIVGQARVRAQVRARYLVLMGVAGVIAALAVINEAPS